MVKIVSFSFTYCLCFLFLNFSLADYATGSSISAHEEKIDSGSSDGANFSHHRTKRGFALLVPQEDAESSEEHHKSKRCWRTRPIQKVRLSSLYPEDIKYSGDNAINDLYDTQKRSVDNFWDSDEVRDETIGKLKLVPIKNPRNNLKDFLRLKNEDEESEEFEDEDDVLRRIKNHLKSDDYKVLALVGKRSGNSHGNNRRKLICYCRDANCAGGNCDRMMYRPCSVCRNPLPGLPGRLNSKWYSNYGREDGRVPLNVRYPPDTRNQFVDDSMHGGDYLQAKKTYNNRVDFALPEKSQQFFHESPRIVINNPNDRIFKVPPVSSKAAIENGVSGYFSAQARPLVNPEKSRTQERQQFFQESPTIVVNNPNDRIFNALPVSSKATIGNGISGGFISTDPRLAMNQYHPAIGNSGMIRPSHREGTAHFRPLGSQSYQYLRAPQPIVTPGYYGTSNNVFYAGHKDGNGLGWGTRPQVYPNVQNFRVPSRKIEYPRTTQASMTSTSLKDVEKDNSHYYTNTEYSLGSTETLGRKSYDLYSDKSIEDDQIAKEYPNGIEHVAGNVDKIDEQGNLDYTGISDEPRKYKYPVIFTDNVYTAEGNGVPETLYGRTTLEPQKFHTVPGIVGSKQNTDHEYSFEEATTHDYTNWDQNTDFGSSDLKVSTESEDVLEYGQGSTTEDYSDIRVITNGYFTSEAFDGLEKVDEVVGSVPKTYDNTDHTYSYEEEASNSSAETAETQMESGLWNENVATTNTGDFPVVDETSINSKNDNLKNIVDTQINQDDEIVSKVEEKGDGTHDDIVIDVTTNSRGDSESREITSRELIPSYEVIDLSSGRMQSEETFGSHENQKSSEAQESASIERVGDEHADSEDYESISLEEESVYTTYEEEDDDDQVPLVSNNVDDVSERLLQKHVDHDKNSITTYSLETPIRTCSVAHDFNLEKTAVEYTPKDSEVPVAVSNGEYLTERADSGDYESLSLEEKSVYTTYEEEEDDDDEVPLVSNNIDDVSERLLQKHVDHDKNSITTYSLETPIRTCSVAHDFNLEKTAVEYTPKDSEVSVAGSNGEYSTLVDNEPAAIDNLATKYYSPNDRVLEYIKKHSQNLVRDSEDHCNHRSTETPELYHTKSVLEYPESEYESASREEILERPFDHDLDQDVSSQESPNEEEIIQDSESQDDTHQVEDNLEKYSDENRNRKSQIAEDSFVPDTIEKVSGGHGGLDYTQYSPNHDYDNQSSPETDLIDDDSRDEDRSSEELLLISGHEENKAKSNSSDLKLQNISKETESRRQDESVLEIQHLNNFSGETTETIEDPRESTSRSSEEDKESLTTSTNEEEEYHSADETTKKSVTEGSLVLETPQTLNEDFDHGNVGIIHMQEQPLLHRDNEYMDYTEESRSDYSTEKSYIDKYSHKDYYEETVTGISTNCKGIDSQQSNVQSYSVESTSKEGVDHEAEMKSIESQEGYPTIKSEKRINDDVVADQILQHRVQTTSNSPEEVESWSEEDAEDHDLQKSSEATSRYDNINDSSSTSLRLDQNLEEMKSVEFVGVPQSTGDCCTRPPEVGDDAGYLGRLAPKNPNAVIRSVGELVNSDLYYIGDGVRLPLTIKKLKDGSFALSISDKICEKRSGDKCPCCVPREGKILEEKRSDELGESGVHRRAVPDLLEHHKRSTRAITMPVDEFVEKYNLILDLDAHESSLTHNVIQRDDKEQEFEEYNSDLVQRLKTIKDLPDDERASVLLSALKELVGTEGSNVLDKELRSLKSREGDDDEGFRYGYQRDNPILDRIETIKKLREKMYECEHKYQKDCDLAVTQKTELLTMILYWIRDIISDKAI